MFGEPLVWDKKEDRSGCMIRSFVHSGGFGKKEGWSKVQDELIIKMVRLERVVSAITGKASKTGNRKAPESVNTTLPKERSSRLPVPDIEKNRARQGKQLVPSEQRNINFWTDLLARAGEKTTLHARISPSKGTWIATAAGMPGVFYQYRVWKDKAAVELYIDGGSKNKQKNHAIFDSFFTHKAEIEKMFGEPLVWDKKEDRSGCIIRSFVHSGGFGERDGWSKVQDELIDKMVRLERAVAFIL